MAVSTKLPWRGDSLNRLFQESLNGCKSSVLVYPLLFIIEYFNLN